MSGSEIIAIIFSVVSLISFIGNILLWRAIVKVTKEFTEVVNAIPPSLKKRREVLIDKRNYKP